MWFLVLLLLTASAAGGRVSTAASSAPTTAAAVEATTSVPSRSARASARVETVTGDVGEAPRPTLSRAAVMAAARAAVAARAVAAARLAGAAGARLALMAAAPAMRAGGGGRAGSAVRVGGGRAAGVGGGPLLVGPVANSSEPRCANVSSVHYSLDMLLGTWYVVEVISPVSVGTVCDGFQLTKLNVSRAWEDLEAEAVIMSRFGRLPGGPTIYFNRTMLVGGGAGASSDGQHEETRGPMLYDQLAVTDYSPGGQYLSITACHEGQHWTYVYGRQPAPAAPEEIRALHARLAAAGVSVSASGTTTTTTPTAPTGSTASVVDDSENDASGSGRGGQAAAGAAAATETPTSTAHDRTPPPWWPGLTTPTPTPLPVFNITECGW
ncbi:uncharacterized protein LOC126209983 [Schistocerca nitens]|uniref:uncharacterized protein LOC126209983 n=1 Tax=Schistocerca nitens TaxID=7011 RepID=UPI002119B553|nr:uncharacterized protein LOC126209983 [Schistocerca nitens]